MVVLGLAAASAALLVPVRPSAPPEPATRDPLLWPFAQDSIWNTPLGSDADYVPASITRARAITVDHEFLSLDPRSPLRTLRVPGQPGDGAQVHVAEDLSHDGSFNGCATLLAEGGRTVWQGQPLTLVESGDPTWQFHTHKEPIDLFGDGVQGCHGGSNMSGVGGSIRLGELDGPGAIRHALKVNLFCERYCWRGSSQDDSRRWPALTADSYWQDYGGDLPALRMGALLALPPSFDVNDLSHPKARKIARALQDYGAYLVDDTLRDVHSFSADVEVVTSGAWPPPADESFHDDLQTALTGLAVVDDNGPGNTGGAGERRAPLAPPFAR